MAYDIIGGIKAAFTNWGSQFATGVGVMPFAPGVGLSAYQVLPAPSLSSSKTSDIFKGLTDQDAIGDVPRVPTEMIEVPESSAVQDMPAGLSRHLIQQ